MNIFILSEDPRQAAIDQCDKHVVKMIVESAQMLSTAHRLLDGEQYIDDSSGRRIKRWRHPKWDAELYKASHINHPCNVWVRESNLNYEWLYCHFLCLSREYTHRYDKVHETDRKLRNILGKHPRNIPNAGYTKYALAMPDEFKTDNVVESYRKYYKSKQNVFKMKWTNRDLPWWMDDNFDRAEL